MYIQAHFNLMKEKRTITNERYARNDEYGTTSESSFLPFVFERSRRMADTALNKVR